MRRAVFLLVAMVLVGSLTLWCWHMTDDAAGVSSPPGTADAAAVARGEYLARAGNCQHCHTRRGGEPYAGGRGIATPFGTVFTSNLTSDPTTGIGAWTANDFWQAMHHGRSRDGRWLVPAFPYDNFTRVTRSDSDALFAWLRTVAPVRQANRAHALDWPYDSQWALGVWRALYFRPGTFKPDTTRSPEWNRGAYLVQGLGHCSACHAARNALGGGSDATSLTGGMIPMLSWYAPSLLTRGEGGVHDWSSEDIVQLLQTGRSAQGWVTGPMVDVVKHSTQHLSREDLGAMAVYLKELPVIPTAVDVNGSEGERGGLLEAGGKVYVKHCSQCHGDAGQGVSGAYPALAGNRAVTLATPVNLVQVVLNGGFAAATAGNPRPFGMPPYALILSDYDVAAVLSYVRTAWGNQAGGVTAQDVDRLRGRSTR